MFRLLKRTAETTMKLPFAVVWDIASLGNMGEGSSTVKVIQPKTNNIKTVDAKKEGTNTNEVKSDTNKKPLSGTEKPIAYVELFLLKIASFIFNSAIVFYLVCLFLVFIIIRFIYKKIRG